MMPFCFHPFSVLRRGVRSVLFPLSLTLCLVYVLYGSQVPFVHAGVAAEVHAAANDTTAVNLKEGDWVYSTYVDRNGESYAAVTGYNGIALEVTVPGTLGGYPVRSVSRETFVGNKYLTKVTVEDGIADIGKYCFQGCVGIRTVSLPATLKSIGEGAFYGCRSLTELELPDSVTKIGDDAFYQCGHLKTARFSASLQSIGDSAFGQCVMLESVTFGESLESIGNEAFQGCVSLRSAALPPDVFTLGKGAFAGCSALTDVSLDDGIEEIPGGTFRGCRSLSRLSLGREIRSVGASAFEGCESLDTVTLGDNVERIGSLAFYNCSGLKSVVLGDSVTSIGFGAFNGCTSLGNITVSENNETFFSHDGILYSVKGNRLTVCPQGAKGKISIAADTVEIDDYAFAGCKKLTSVVFPESMSKIGMASFLSCTDLTNMTIPAAVDKMGCLSVGYYFHDGVLKKAPYVNVFGQSNSTSGVLPETGSASELYCAAHDVSFQSFGNTLMLNTEHAVLTEGASFKLERAFLSGAKAKVQWETSDPSVVKVENGTLKALANGEAEVTASAEGFEPRTVKVTVIKRNGKASSEKRSYDRKRIYRGESEELSSLLDQIIDPLLAVNKFWYTSNPGVAVVSADGRVTAVGNGNANITCRLPDGSENYVWITVSERLCEFSLIQPAEEWVIGDTRPIETAMLPARSTDVIEWRSDDPDVAVVDAKGNVTAVSQGNCEITAAAASGLTDTVTVTCVIPADEISIPMDTRSVYQGKEFNLPVDISPADSQQRVTWRSSDPSIVSVNSKGKVTGVSFGTATVYAETASGAEDSCVVNVMVKAERLAIDVKQLTLNAGDTHALHAVAFPSYSPETTEPCFWNSTDEAVAAVDENGIVTAVGAGNCIINCKTDGGLISKCSVTVKLPAESVDIAGDTDSLYIGETTTLHLKLMPKNTTDKVEWSSDNESVAKVTSQGTVKGRSAGTAVIMAAVTNEVSDVRIVASYEIHVLKAADSVKLKKKSLSLNVGDTDSLLYVIAPSDSNDTVSWSSSDESVATVREDGLITALRSGSCYVTVKTGSGCSAKCKIVVN